MKPGITLNDIISLAKSYELGDPIDWDYLNVREDDVYSLLALSLKEMMDVFETREEKEIASYAVILKLLVENFVLNLQMRKLCNVESSHQTYSRNS